MQTPESTIAPLIQQRTITDLEAKFSLPYAAAAALANGHPGFVDLLLERREQLGLTYYVCFDYELDKMEPMGLLQVRLTVGLRDHAAWAA